MSIKKKVLWALFILVCAGVSYVGGQYYLDNVKPPDVSPGQVVERYFDALNKRELEDAYNMVSRKHYFESFNQFVDRVSMYAPDMVLEVNWEKIEDTVAVVNVNITVPMRFGIYSSESEMDLVRAEREWKIIHP